MSGDWIEVKSKNQKRAKKNVSDLPKDSNDSDKTDDSDNSDNSSDLFDLYKMYVYECESCGQVHRRETKCDSYTQAFFLLDKYLNNRGYLSDYNKELLEKAVYSLNEDEYIEYKHEADQVKDMLSEWERERDEYDEWFAAYIKEEEDHYKFIKRLTEFDIESYTDDKYDKYDKDVNLRLKRRSSKREKQHNLKIKKYRGTVTKTPKFLIQRWVIRHESDEHNNVTCERISSNFMQARNHYYSREATKVKKIEKEKEIKSDTRDKAIQARDLSSDVPEVPQIWICEVCCDEYTEICTRLPDLCERCVVMKDNESDDASYDSWYDSD